MSYEFKGKGTVCVKSKKSGRGKRQATIHLTVLVDGVSRVLPLLIFRGAVDGMSATRKKEAKRHHPGLQE